MRFPLAHQLESMEIQFAFMTKMFKTTLLSTYSQAIYSPKSHTFEVIHPDGMSVYLTDGLLVVVAMLRGQINVSLAISKENINNKCSKLSFLFNSPILNVTNGGLLYLFVCTALILGYWNMFFKLLFVPVTTGALHRQMRPFALIWVSLMLYRKNSVG